MKKMHGFALLSWVLMTSVVMGAGAPVLLDWGTVDTGSAVAQTKSRTLRTSSRATTEQDLSIRGTAPWLVQFNDVIRPEWKTALVNAGAEIKGYIPENAFLIEATPKGMATIGAMPEVDWVGEYLPEYKRAKPVRTLLAKKTAGTREYSVMLFRSEDGARIGQALAEISGVEVTVVEGELIRALLPSSVVETLSDWGEVQWIEPYNKPQLWNNVAARSDMMNTTNVWDTLGLTGAGQTIAVCDTGLDTGNTGTLHRDFTNRVTGFGWTNGSYSASYTWADYDAHGSHVCGSVLGNGTMSSGLYKGIAYEANLIMQSANASLDGIPANLNTLFQQAFDNGARIHSDSWGYDDDGYYSADSRYLDMFTWSNKTMLVLIAAGNQGVDANSDGVVDYDSIGSPGTAKNCMTVGASESDRPEFSAYSWGSSWPDDFPEDPIFSDELSGPDDGVNQGIAAFSSRGPCDDGRIKPDLMAPGTDIISTRSTQTSDTGWGVAPNTNYLYMGGTSMATPLTAGAAGLTRQWLMSTGALANPSAALVKGLMINGARDMSPGQYGTGSYREIPATRPNHVQGWGHVDLFHTLQPSTNQFLDLYDANSLSTGQSNTFSLTVTSVSTNTFILTLAYSDYWATAGSGKKLVNDLDLTVRTPLGSTVYANGRTSLDATNNVEMVEFAADEVGTYTVTVNARTVPSGSSQPYALVIRGPKADETPTAPSFGANPGPVSAQSGVLTNFTVAASGYPIPVLALQSTTAAGGSYLFEAATGYCVYEPPVGDIGSQTFTFTATNTEGSVTQTVTVGVSEGPPAAPAAIWASATNTTDFTAAWSAVSGATSYRLDVATNDTFSGGGAVASDLFLSEYIEGSSNNKAVEIFNGTGASVDLGAGDYELRLYYNGNTTFTTIDLTGTLADNDVFVVANGSANAAILAEADATSTSLTFNGNDVVALTKSSSNIDVLGTIGSSTDFAQNVTKVRKSSVTEGTTTYATSEWDDAASDTTSDLGSHSFDGGPGEPSFVAGYSNLTVSGTSQSVTGLTGDETYSFRARAVSAGGTSANSPTATVTTLTGVSAPVFNALGAQSAEEGVADSFTVSATGSPTPTLALQSTTAASGYSFTAGTGELAYTPPTADVGAQSFTFTASNSQGVDTQVVSVTVSAAGVPPTVSFSADRVVGEEGAASVSLPVNLSFAANATVQVAIAGTASNGTDFSCSTTLVFSASATSNLIFSITDDELPEGPETALLTLNPVSGATLGTTTQAVIIVRDNDAFSILSGNLSSGTTTVYDVTTYDDPGGRILEALQPDVMLIQEWVLKSGVTYRDFVDEYFGTNFYYHVEDQPGTYYPQPNGIISRWPITASNTWADSEVSNRDFPWAQIDLPGLRDLYAVSVHLKATGDIPADDLAIRIDEAQALTNYIAQASWPASDYMVLGGDLNLVNRSEETLAVLTNVVSDVHQPADQDGDKDTNSGRSRPYDVVLPNDVLDARHASFTCYGNTFANGMVFDTRPSEVTWANGLPPPALADDSDAVNMQHMAVLKIFEFETSVEPPQAFSAAAASQVQIDLTFTANVAAQDVVIVENSDGNFGTPTGTVPSVGGSLAGGTVVYSGTSSPQSHTGLSASETVYYSCWSVVGTNYSGGLTANATTEGLNAPASIWASATNSTDFTAAWSAVSGASSYRLDVSTNAVFSGAGGGGETLIDEDFTDFSDWTDDGTANDTSHAGDSSPARAFGPEDTLTSPAVDYPTQMVFFVDSSSGGNGKTTTNYYSLDGGSTWLPIGTFTVGTAGSTETQALTSSPDLSGETNVMFRFVSAFYTWYLDDVVVTGGSGGSPSFVPGYEDLTVAGTSQSVTGLTADATYHFRARAVSGGDTSDNSPTGSVVTLGSGTPPVMVAIPDQVTGVGADFEYTVTATEGDGDSFTFACTSAVDEANWAVDTNGDFLFIPTVTEVGTHIFVFTATDKDGTSAPAQMSIRVNTQAATNAFEEWVQDQGEDPGNTNFTENADFDGDGATTEEEYLADTDPALAGSVLMLTGSYTIATGGGTGDIVLQFPASTGRYYQLEYCTGLTNYLVGTSNLGWGVSGMAVTNNSTGTWYGVIRAFLSAP